MSVIYEKHYPHPTFEEEMEELKKCEKEWISLGKNNTANDVGSIAGALIKILK